MKASPISTALSAINKTSERLRRKQLAQEASQGTPEASASFNIRTSNLNDFHRYVEQIWNWIDDLEASLEVVPITLLLRNINCQGFLNYEFRPRPESPRIDSLYMSVSGMTLPNWGSYCDNSTDLQLYRSLIENLSKVAYPKKLHSTIEQILLFETELSRRLFEKGITSTSIKASEFFDLSRANESFPELFNSRCLRFLRRFIFDDGLVLVSPDAFSVLDSYLRETPVSIIRDWLKFKLVLGLVDFGPEPLAATKSAFFEKVYGLTPGHFSIDRLDASAFNKINDSEIALAFRDEFGGNNLTKDVYAIFDQCRSAVFSALTREVCTDERVNHFIKSKLDSMTITILPAAEDCDRFNLDNCCDFIDWIIRSSGILEVNSAYTLSLSLNRNHFTIPAASCSCFYRAETNEIEIGAGCLHPFVIDRESYRDVNISPLSFMIAHEIGHAFDSNCLEIAVTDSISTEHYLQIISHFKEFHGRIRNLAYQVASVNSFTPSMIDDGLNEIIADCISTWSHREMLCNAPMFSGGVPGGASAYLSAFLNPLWVDSSRFESNRSDHHPPAEFRRILCRELV